jgi:rhodanese-related sulfurtransferase
VPEISVEGLQVALASDVPPLVIDVREAYEWRLVRLAAARHLPMNEVPSQLDTLPHDCAIVVMCAHGSRSYSVAAWLIEQGYAASSLAGGITEWAKRGGPVEQG